MGLSQVSRPERLSECLSAWMGEQKVSVAELAQMVGYRSKTSVFRLLKNQCNEQTGAAFVKSLSSHLDNAWIARFEKALRVEKNGLETQMLFDAMDESINGAAVQDEICDESLLPSGGETVYVLGYPWPATFLIIDGLLQKGFRVRHYIDRKQILSNAELLRGLLLHVLSLRYEAVMIGEKPFGIWDLMITDAGQLFANGKWFASECDLSVVPDGGIPLYRYSRLQNGSDYIAFMEDAYQLESGGAAVIAKKSPGIQMIPEEITDRALAEYQSQNRDPVFASLGSLRLLLRKRINLFYQRETPVTIVFVQEAMEEFMRTGSTGDNFYAVRPYTMEERIAIIRALEEFSHKKNVTMVIRDRKAWDFCMEAYDHRGLLIYPSQTKYNSELEKYRELFLPGQEFFDLFAAKTEALKLEVPAEVCMTQFMRKLNL